MPETTTQRSPNHVRGVLLESSDDRIVIEIPDSSYQIHLKVYQPLSTPVGKRVVGTIRANARRITVTKTGGRYIEPVYGRPRNIQGAIVATDPSEQTVTIHAGAPIVCKLPKSQRAEQFSVGDFVTSALEPGATFVAVSGG